MSQIARTLLLLVPSSAVLVLFVLHSRRLRGGRVTLAFFASAFLFGVLRGNVIHEIMTRRFHGAMPYVFTQPVVWIGGASLQECIGWMFATYLSWAIAEAILARFPGAENRLGPTVALVTVGMGGVSYAVEAASNAIGWWRWSVPVQNAFFLDAPPVGIVDWMSVGFDFFLPFAAWTLVRPRRRALAWATLLVFPAHIVTHSFLTWTREATAMDTDQIWHWAMLWALLLLAMLDGTPLRDREPDAKAGRLAAVPAWALAVVIVVVGLVDLRVAGRPALLVSLVPLVVLFLLGRRKVPGVAVAAACAAAAFVSPRLAVAVSPVVAWVALGLRGTGALRRIPGQAAVALCLLASTWGISAYLRQEAEKKEVMFAQRKLFARALQAADGEEAMRLARRSLEISPYSARAHYEMGQASLAVGDREAAERSFRRSIEIFPSFLPGYLALGRELLARGEAREAREVLAIAVDIAPELPDAREGLAAAERALEER